MAKSRFGGFVYGAARSASSFTQSFADAGAGPGPVNPVVYSVGYSLGSFANSLSAGPSQNPLGAFAGIIQSVAATAVQAREFRREQTSLLGLRDELISSVPLGRQGLNRISEIGRDPRLREDERRHVQQAIAFAEQETRRGKREVVAAESIARQRAYQAAQMRSVAHRARSQVRAAETTYQKASATQKQAVGAYRQRFLEARKARRDYASAVLNLPILQQAVLNARTQHQRAAAIQAVQDAQKIIKDAPKTMARTKRAQLQAVGAAKRATAQAKVAQQQVQAARTTYATRAAKAVRATHVARSAQRNIQRVQAQAQHRNRQAMARAGRVATRTVVGVAKRTAQRASIVALGNLAGVAGKVVDGLIAIARTTIDSIRALRVFAESINESNRYLASYNANIATAFMELDFGRMSRNFRTAAFTQDSAAELAKANNRMEEAWLKFNANVQDMKNQLGIGAANAGAFFGPIAGEMAGVANMALKVAGALVDPKQPNAIVPPRVPFLPGFDMMRDMFNLPGDINKLNEQGVGPFQMLGQLAKQQLAGILALVGKADMAVDLLKKDKALENVDLRGPADQFAADMANGKFRHLPVIPPHNVPRRRGGFG